MSQSLLQHNSSPSPTNSRRAPKLALIAFVTVVVLVAASWAYRWGAARNPTLTEDTAGAVYSDAPANADFTDRLIENLQEKLRQYPDDAHSYGLLGAAYLQKVRESGDPGYYSKAEAALKKALELDPENFETLTTAGALALARHQFQEGLEHGQRAHALNPYNARALGVVADALIELGIYDAGFETVQKMVDTRPDMSSYARVSYARELNGDVAGALEAMRLAVEAGSALPENTAWALTQVGLLLFNHGDLEAAEREFEAAARALPDYLPAQAGLAKVKAARGDLKGAITLYERITQVLPLSEYVIALSDCYAAAGRAEAAQRQYDLVKVLAQLQQANGVDTDLEITLFEADHPNLFSPLNETVARARRVYEKRPTIYAADVLAWALYQSGQYAEAQMYAREALKLNTQDALLWFHAGMIAARLGQVDDARQKLEQALKINPHFSLLWADVARQTLSDLPAS